MSDGRRTRWVAHDVYFLDEGLGHAMFERFGAAGVALWHGFIAACKKNHIEGQTSYASVPEALATLGLPGLNLVNNDGEPFVFEDWLKLLSDHKVIRRTSRGRRVKVACTRWARWQQAANRSRKADQQAHARAVADEQNRRSDTENTDTIPARHGHDVGPKQAQMTDLDTDLKPLGADAPQANGRKRDLVFEAIAEVCGLDRSQLTDTERGRVNKAAKELREINATPEGIHYRAREFVERWPGMDLTPQALTGNYTLLGKPRPKENAVTEGQGLQVYREETA